MDRNGLYKILVSGCLVLFTAGCAHKIVAEDTQSAVRGEQPKHPLVPITEPVVLKLVGEKGRKEVSHLCSVTTTKAFDRGHLLHKKIETLEFKVQTVTKDVLPNGSLVQDMETLSKDGKGALHDLAYPEPGEIIEMMMTPKAEVKKAGNFPTASIFYVPPIPLPDHPVKTGDHWKQRTQWQSDGTGMPLTVEIDAKMAGTQACGNAMCVVVIVDGHVHLDKKREKKNQYHHHLRGRFLFEPSHGLLTWSEFESTEGLKAEGARLEILSSLRSELVEPPEFRTADHGEPFCPAEIKAE